MIVTIRYSSRRTADYDVTEECLYNALANIKVNNWFCLNCPDGTSHVINPLEVEEIVVS